MEATNYAALDDKALAALWRLDSAGPGGLSPVEMRDVLEDLPPDLPDARCALGFLHGMTLHRSDDWSTQMLDQCYACGFWEAWTRTMDAAFTRRPQRQAHRRTVQ